MFHSFFRLEFESIYFILKVKAAHMVFFFLFPSTELTSAPFMAHVVSSYSCPYMPLVSLHSFVPYL